MTFQIESKYWEEFCALYQKSEAGMITEHLDPRSCNVILVGKTGAVEDRVRELERVSVMP